MNKKFLLAPSLLTVLLSTAAIAQEWNDDQLIAATKGFQGDSLAARLKQVGALNQLPRA